MGLARIAVDPWKCRLRSLGRLRSRLALGAGPRRWLATGRSSPWRPSNRRNFRPSNQMRSAMNIDIRKMKLPPKARGTTLHARIEEFLHFKSLTCTHSTFVDYRSTLRQLEKYIHKNNVKEVGVRAIYGYFIERSSIGLSPYTVYQDRAHLATFFGWCVKLGYMATNPVDAMPAGAFKKSPPNHKTFTVAEYEALKRASIGTEFYYAIVCAWHTALRISDVCYLRWRDVDLEAGFIAIVPIKTRRTGKRATVPIHPELREVLEARKAVAGGGEFVSDDLAAQFTRDNKVYAKFNAIVKKAGIEGRTFHALRHTALERWMNSPNADTVTVMDISGHVTANTLAKYCRPSLDKKRLIMGIKENEQPKRPGQNLLRDELQCGGAEEGGGS